MGFRRKPVPIVFKGCMSSLKSSCFVWEGTSRVRYRDLIEMMNERGLLMAHTTIMRWVFRFSGELKARVRPYLRKCNSSWRVDETYVKVNGKWVYLFRAIDKNGQTIDFYLSETRNYMAAERFFKRILNTGMARPPRIITVDKNPAYPLALSRLKAQKQYWRDTRLRAVKYLNNVIEQDHRSIKNKTNSGLGYKSFRTAWYTITGLETMHMLRKGRALGSYQPRSPQLLRNFIHRLFGLNGSIFTEFSNAWSLC